MSKLPYIYPWPKLIPVVTRSDEKQQIRFIRQVTKKLQREKRNSLKRNSVPEYCRIQKQTRNSPTQSRIAKALDALNQIIRNKTESTELKQGQLKKIYLNLPGTEGKKCSALSTKVKPMCTAQTQIAKAVRTGKKESTIRSSSKTRRNNRSALYSKFNHEGSILTQKHETDETSAKNIKSSSPKCVHKSKSICSSITLVNPSFPAEDRRPRISRIQKYFDDLEHEKKKINKHLEKKIQEKLETVQKSKLPDNIDCRHFEGTVEPHCKLDSEAILPNDASSDKEQNVNNILTKKQELDTQLKKINVHINRIVREKKDVVNPSPLDDVSFKSHFSSSKKLDPTLEACRLRSEKLESSLEASRLRPETSDSTLKISGSQTDQSKYPVTQSMAITKNPAASQHGSRQSSALQFHTQPAISESKLPAKNYQNTFMKPWCPAKATHSTTKKDEGFYSNLKKKLFFWRNRQTKEPTESKSTDEYALNIKKSTLQSSSQLMPPPCPMISHEAHYQINQPQSAPSPKYQDIPSTRPSAMKNSDAVRDFTTSNMAPRNIEPPVTKCFEKPRAVETTSKSFSWPHLPATPSVVQQQKPQIPIHSPPQCFAFQPQTRNDALQMQPPNFAIPMHPQNVALQPQMQNFALQSQPQSFPIQSVSQSFACQPPPQMVHSSVMLPFNQVASTNVGQTPMQMQPLPFPLGVTKLMQQHPHQSVMRSMNSPYPYQTPITASMYQFPTFPFNPQQAAVTMPKQLMHNPANPFQQYPSLAAVMTSKQPYFYQSAVTTPVNQCPYVTAVPMARQPNTYQTAIATPMYQYPNKAVIATPKQSYVYQAALPTPILRNPHVY